MLHNFLAKNDRTKGIGRLNLEVRKVIRYTTEPSFSGLLCLTTALSTICGEKCNDAIRY